MYVKLFEEIRQSSIWAEDSDTRIVWITLLTMADMDGLVRARATGISIQSRVPLAKVREALKLFQEPDMDSRTPDHEGRRIEETEEGFVVLNYRKYREYVSEVDRKQKAAERQKRFREKMKTDDENSNASVTPRNARVTHSNDMHKKKQNSEKEALTSHTACGREFSLGNENDGNGTDPSPWASHQERQPVADLAKEVFGNLPPPIVLNGWRKDHSPDHIMQALREAAACGAKSSKYATAILEAWKHGGYPPSYRVRDGVPNETFAEKMARERREIEERQNHQQEPSDL